MTLGQAFHVLVVIMSVL